MTCLLAEFGKGHLPFFLGIFPKKCIIELCGGGGTADTHASGACAPSGVRVQILSPHLGKVAQLGTAPDSKSGKWILFTRGFKSRPFLTIQISHRL